MNEKVLPHNIDAEKSVLGSMFLSKYALQKSLEALNKELFYLDSHSKIFETIIFIWIYSFEILFLWFDIYEVKL